MAEKKPTERILIVDDDEVFCRNAEAEFVAKKGWEVKWTASPESAHTIWREWHPAVGVIDWLLPGQPNGDQLIRSILLADPTALLIMRTAHPDLVDAATVLESGAFDFMIVSMGDMRELCWRIKRALRFRDETQGARERTLQMRRSYFDIVRALATSIDARSEYTKQHSDRVASYAVLIGESSGLSDNMLKTLDVLGRLHDVGKLGTPDSILNKTEGLSDEEWEIMKRHASSTRDILQHIYDHQPELQHAHSHHENLDGSGYPDGLLAKDIGLFARILRVADSVDAMFSNRPYRTARDKEYVVSELKAHAPSWYDQDVVDCCIKLIERMKHNSSTHCATCGNRLLTGRPL